MPSGNTKDLWDVVVQEFHIMDVQQLCDATTQHPSKASSEVTNSVTSNSSKVNLITGSE